MDCPENIRQVRATAYNAEEAQTDDTPTICAWGDKIRPGIIAISRDLEALGLSRGTKVHVEGYGWLTVLDRMHKRKKNQIDIYMLKRQDALEFGVQELTISWE
jgi:3D (Asp-Asp-Asp) domain-containing protein